MRFCLVGGTFDPPHWGHLLLAETLRTSRLIDQIVFVPAFIPPHKRDDLISSAQHRVRMLQLACEGNSYFSVDTREIERGGLSYTIETVREIKAEYALQSGDLGLLIGSDNFVDLQSWKHSQALVRECRVLVMERSGHPVPAQAPFREEVEFVDLPLVEISSSQIRRRVGQGLSVQYYVLPSVQQYIQEHALYQGPS